MQPTKEQLEQIEKNFERLPKRPTTEATAEREYFKMINKVKETIKQKQNKARDEFLTM